MKFLGFSFNEIPSFIKLVYFVVFMGAIGFAIMYGLKKIDDTNKPKNSPNKKKRVSPKKSQWWLNRCLYLLIFLLRYVSLQSWKLNPDQIHILDTAPIIKPSIIISKIGMIEPFYFSVMAGILNFLSLCIVSISFLKRL